MKIGILTFHSAHNYGAKLQAYALTEYLKSLGHNAEIINYRPPYFKKIYYWINLNDFRGLNPIRYVWALMNYLVRSSKRIIRYRNFQRFEKQFMTISKVIVGDIPDNYDAYIVGSDQVWSKSITNGFDSNYLFDFNFEKGNKKYISYAPSTENKELNPELQKKLKPVLEKLDAISVREKGVRDFLQPLVSKEISHVLDPTFLLDQSSWNQMVRERKIKEKYVLFYQVRTNDIVYQRAKEFAKREGCKLVQLHSLINSRQDNSYSTASPSDFVNFVRYADYIITSSFHGTALSVIFQKKFFVFTLKDGRDGRVISLLSTLGIENTIMSLTDNFDMNAIDYSNATKILNEEKQKSYSFLNNALL